MDAVAKVTLHRVRKDDPTLAVLQIGSKFMLCSKIDLASFGNAIAKNTCIERLVIDDNYAPTLEVPQQFIDGITQNSSIYDLRLLFCDIISEDIPREAYEILQVFCSKGSLKKISLKGCPLRGGDQILAATLQSCKSINYISLTQIRLNDEHLAKIVTACREHDQLKVLELSKNDIGMDGCEALAGLLQQPHCNIITICLDENSRIDDSCVTVIANSLAKNKTLKKLYLDRNWRITRSGWDDLSQVLCNTATINATYSSNHTLRSVGEHYPNRWVESMPTDNLSSILTLNGCVNNKQVAMKKILRCHPHLDMEHFFDWGLKLLPFVVGWFDGAKICTDGTPENIDRRKLDAIYQYTRAMPMMFDVKTPPKKWPFTTTMSLSVFMAIISVLLYMVREFVKARWEDSNTW